MFGNYKKDEFIIFISRIGQRNSSNLVNKIKNGRDKLSQ